jgi:hypothetical protein
MVVVGCAVQAAVHESHTRAAVVVFKGDRDA